MCEQCEGFTADGRAVLDSLLDVRRQHHDALSGLTPAQRIAEIADLLNRQLPASYRDHTQVENLCLAMAVAVERLYALTELIAPSEAER